MATSKTLNLVMLAVCFLLAAAAAGLQAAQAMKCDEVYSDLLQCEGYARSGSLTAGCCHALKRLHHEARHSHHAVCQCLRRVSSDFPRVKAGTFAKVAVECGLRAHDGRIVEHCLK